MVFLNDEVNKMAEDLQNKCIVDIDKLLKYLLDNGFDINDGVFNKYEKSLKEVFDEYRKSIVPDVEIGQTVWVVSKSRKEYLLRKCYVHKKQVRSRHSFSVKGKYCYYGTFTKNSIGKTVFFSKEAAIKSLNGKAYDVEE